MLLLAVRDEACLAAGFDVDGTSPAAPARAARADRPRGRLRGCPRGRLRGCPRSGGGESASRMRCPCPRMRYARAAGRRRRRRGR